MKRIVYVVLSILISLNAYCQQKGRMFFIKKLPLSAKNKVLHLQSKSDSIGIVVDKNWYRITKEKSDSHSMFCRVYNYSDAADTIKVYSAEDDFSFKLILTPFQRDLFMENTQFMHASHMSHRSHYSHFSGK